MEPWSYELAGRFEEHAFESEVLKDNALGDPHVRPLWVYLPPGYDEDEERRYPSIYLIQGLTGQLDMWRNRTPFRRNFPELADELFAGDAFYEPAAASASATVSALPDGTLLLVPAPPA